LLYWTASQSGHEQEVGRPPRLEFAVFEDVERTRHFSDWLSGLITRARHDRRRWGASSLAHSLRSDQN
jgi:hypothetical protein